MTGWQHLLVDITVYIRQIKRIDSGRMCCAGILLPASYFLTLRPFHETLHDNEATATRFT
jgi:hypothetical protein